LKKPLEKKLLPGGLRIPITRRGVNPTKTETINVFINGVKNIFLNKTKENFI